MPGDVAVEAEQRSSPSTKALVSSLETLSNDTTHLPTVYQCSVHLNLLEAIYVLQSKVQQLAQIRKGDPLVTWNLFLKLAVARFVIWIKENQSPEDLKRLPSLDILMVWHAFMLNPGPYSKFERVVLMGRLKGGGFNWQALQIAIGANPSIFRLVEEDEQALQAVNLHPDLLSFLSSDSGATFTTHLQQGSDFDGMGPKETRLLASFTVLSASNHIYHTPNTRFSFDLASAVNRQFKFTTKMVSFNWLRSPYASASLTHAIERYSKFFALMAANPQKMLAPTLEVDLAWHTHQLSPACYRKYCIENAGHFINHNDMITEAEASSSFAAAGNAHRDEFESEYALCLCWYCEAGRYSGLEVSNSKEFVSKCIDEEIDRRKNSGLDLDMSFAKANCQSCGSHPNSRCSLQQSCGVKSSDCGGCNGECGDGGCGSCGGGGFRKRASQLPECDGGCGSCNGECGNGGCGGCSNLILRRIRGKGSDCNGSCGSCNGECSNGGCGGCSGATYDN